VIPENLQFGGGVAHTFLSPVVLLAIIVAGLLICFSTRRRASAAFLVAAILIPVDQVLFVGGLHFPMLRILALCGLLRILRGRLSGRHQIFSGGMNGIDKAVIGLGVFTFINGILLWRIGAQVVYQLGNLCDVFGAYFLLRFVIRDEEDVRAAIRTLACVAAVVALLMGSEQATGKNLLYSALGGARASTLGSVLDRDDHLRATGSFAHPNLAGTFGGITLPLFLGLWLRDKKERTYAALGIAAASVIPFAASSSTALSGFLGGILGLCLWPLRRRMRVIRWGIVVVLVSLHLVMKAPVWHLVARLDLTGSSSSYHRYQLINQCIIHFSDWMLVGTKSFADWGFDMWDLSDQYVAIADVSGLIPLVCFFAIIVLGFRYAGRARLAYKGDKGRQLFAWALGSSLFANVVAFFGISYFDQTIVVWYALLALIAATAVSARTQQHDSALLSKALTVDPESDRVSTEVAHLGSGSSLDGLGGPMQVIW
jgi:hypothetical protein